MKYKISMMIILCGSITILGCESPKLAKNDWETHFFGSDSEGEDSDFSIDRSPGGSAMKTRRLNPEGETPGWMRYAQGNDRKTAKRKLVDYFEKEEPTATKAATATGQVQVYGLPPRASFRFLKSKVACLMEDKVKPRPWPKPGNQ